MRTPAALTISLAVLAAAACRPREAEAPQEPPAAAQPAPRPEAPVTTTPLTYESKTPHAEVKLTLPREVAEYPALHRQVFEQGVRELRQFSEGAQADRTEYGGPGGLPPYAQSREWSVSGQTPRLLGLKAVLSEYTGGAHPNNGYTALIWDKTAGAVVEPQSLFARGFDQAALNRALCQAVTAAKRERVGADVPFPDSTWECPAWSETAIALAPANAAGKARGLVFLIGPYVVGPYAEGGYEVTVPTATLRPFLAPAYADQFA